MRDMPPLIQKTPNPTPAGPSIGKSARGTLALQGLVGAK